jgi:hypothetical protein
MRFCTFGQLRTTLLTNQRLAPSVNEDHHNQAAANQQQRTPAYVYRIPGFQNIYYTLRSRAFPDLQGRPPVSQDYVKRMCMLGISSLCSKLQFPQVTVFYSVGSASKRKLRSKVRFVPHRHKLDVGAKISRRELLSGKRASFTLQSRVAR